ncbi:MAG TPA: hypothetical protein VGR49_05265 [Actinomycetota bacterium]|nr:hypothetical protein [Actinomycetota bacterium]
MQAVELWVDKEESKPSLTVTSGATASVDPIIPTAELEEARWASSQGGAERR